VTLGGNQRRQVLRNETHPIGSPAKETHPTNMHLQYEIIGNGLYPVTNTTTISNGLKQPITDRALSGNGLYKPVTDRFNICNEFSLTYVTKNLCNERLRSQLPEVHIGNGRCGGQPRGHPGVIIGNGRQTTTATDVDGCNGR
jgi:hypothetical protein